MLSLLYDQDYVGSMSPQKLSLCYRLPTRGRVGTKLGDAWYVQNVSIIFFMFHACYILITTCLSYTLYHFYAFSGTNLLTRCHSVSSCFLLSFCFRNSILEISSEFNANLTDLFLDRGEAAAQRRRPEASRGRQAGPRRGQGWARTPRPPPLLGCPLTPSFRL